MVSDCPSSGTVKLIHSLHSSRDSKLKETLVANKHGKHKLPPGAPDSREQFSLRVFCCCFVGWSFIFSGFGCFWQCISIWSGKGCAECLLAVTGWRARMFQYLKSSLSPSLPVGSLPRVGSLGYKTRVCRFRIPEAVEEHSCGFHGWGEDRRVSETTGYFFHARNRTKENSKRYKL